MLEDLIIELIRELKEIGNIKIPYDNNYLQKYTIIAKESEGWGVKHYKYYQNGLPKENKEDGIVSRYMEVYVDYEVDGKKFIFHLGEIYVRMYKSGMRILAYYPNAPHYLGLEEELFHIGEYLFNPYTFELVRIKKDKSYEKGGIKNEVVG